MHNLKTCSGWKSAGSYTRMQWARHAILSPGGNSGFHNTTLGLRSRFKPPCFENDRTVLKTGDTEYPGGGSRFLRGLVDNLGASLSCTRGFNAMATFRASRLLGTRVVGRMSPAESHLDELVRGQPRLTREPCESFFSDPLWWQTRSRSHVRCVDSVPARLTLGRAYFSP